MKLSLRRLEPDRVRVDPLERFTSGGWPAFLVDVRSCGCRWDPGEKSWTAPIGQVGAIVRRLRGTGFDVALDSALETSLSIINREERRTAETAEATLARREVDLHRRGLRLYPYQRDGIAWLMGRISEGKGALLDDEMGLGKTIQALVALPERRPVVAVCPASVKGVWDAETATWRPDYFRQVLSGAGSFRWPLAGGLMILNWDILPRIERRKGEPLRDDLPPAPAGTILIADEVQAVKTSGTLRTLRLRALARMIRDAGGLAIGLSGTPLENHETDLWHVLYSLDLHEEAFDDWPTFQRLFDAHKESVYVKRGQETRLDLAGRPVRDVIKYGAPAPEVPERIRRVALRRRMDDVLPDLPGVTYRSIMVDLPNDVQKICDEALAALTARGIDLRSVEQLVELTRPGMPGWELISKARAALAAAKIGVMRDLIIEHEESETPLIVFSCHRAPVDAAGERSGWKTITGDVNSEERTRIVADFQSGGLRGLAMTIKAGGVGITLTHAHHALFVDRWWNPAVNNQAIYRLRRIGQRHHILVTYLVADHVLDTRVAEVLDERQRLFDATVEAAAVEPETEFNGGPPL